MIRKPHLHRQVILLRQKGLSYNEIIRIVPVSRSTISRWCKYITLTQKQKERLVKKRQNNKFIRSLVEGAKIDIKEAKVWARNYIVPISNIDPFLKLIIIGSSLYWAEGTKLSNNNHRLEFTNTDPKMIQIMLRFFKEILLIPPSKVKLMVRIDKNGNLDNAIHYWANITSIPITNFLKPEQLTLQRPNQSLNRHPYGMCRLTVNSTSAVRKIHYLIYYLYKKYNYW